MIKTNKEKIVMMSIQGKVASPVSRGRFAVDSDGKPFLLPSIGGISYNIKVGDSAFGWAGDHLEPGVSTILDEEKKFEPINQGFHFLACVGNEVRVINGDAKDAIGIVTGHHGGAEHVMVDFDQGTLDKLTMDDKFLIKGYGQGLELLDYPDIKLYNLDPNLFEKLNISEKNNVLEVPVTTIVPGALMGSGVGSVSMGTGDYDIMTTDKELIKQLGIDKIKFGDFVGIENHDNLYGRSYRKGAVTIGIVIHSDCRLAGHGPGVTTLMSCSTPMIEPILNSGANIANILKIGTERNKK